MQKVIYNQTGKAVDKINLDSTVFEAERVNDQLLHQVCQATLSNRRIASATTKNRARVSGSNRKLIPQKKTGRARQGSVKNPLLRGGGVIFGPTGQQNYKKKVNRRSKRVALRQALSSQVDSIKIVDQLQSDGKTKSINQVLKDKLKLDNNILIVVGKIDASLRRSVNNLDRVELRSVNYLSALDLLGADSILIDRDAIDYLSTSLIGEGQ